MTAREPNPEALKWFTALPRWFREVLRRGDGRPMTSDVLEEWFSNHQKAGVEGAEEVWRKGK